MPIFKPKTVCPFENCLEEAVSVISGDTVLTWCNEGHITVCRIAKLLKFLCMVSDDIKENKD